IMNGLNLKITGGYNRRDSRTDIFYNSKTPNGSNRLTGRGVNAQVTNRNSGTWSSESLLSYKKRFDAANQIDALAGFSILGTNRNQYGYRSQNIPNEELGMSGIDHGTPYFIQAVESDNRLLSFFGNINYNLQSKYLFT